MNYKDLLNKLQALTPEQLNQTVTIYEPYEDEYIAAIDVGFSEEANCDALDPNHFYLILKA
jgi:hypothetical protein